jgi:carboxylesterase type B
MIFYILFYYDYFSYLYSCQINFVVNCNYLLLYINKLKLSNCNKNMWIFQVTIFGHGVGATSVAIHMTSQKSLGLFRSAIIQSLPFSLPLKTLDEARVRGQNFSLMLECSNLECMRSKSPWAILETQQKTNSQHGTFLQRLRPWGPRIDNNDVPSDIQVVFRYARIHDIPLLIGTTTAKGPLFSF